MPSTPRMNWPIPAENADPWYQAFIDLMGAVDASSYASREDRNTVVMGGGTVTFSVSMDTVAWDAAIELSTSTGFILSLPAGSLNITNGEVGYVVLPRYPTSNATLSIAAATSLAAVPGGVDADDVFALFLRRNNVLYFRNGVSWSDGQSHGFSPSSGGGGSTGIVSAQGYSAGQATVKSGSTGTGTLSAVLSLIQLGDSNTTSITSLTPSTEGTIDWFVPSNIPNNGGLWSPGYAQSHDKAAGPGFLTRGACMFLCIHGARNTVTNMFSRTTSNDDSFATTAALSGDTNVPIASVGGGLVIDSTNPGPGIRLCIPATPTPQVLRIYIPQGGCSAQYYAGLTDGSVPPVIINNSTTGFTRFNDDPNTHHQLKFTITFSSSTGAWLNVWYRVTGLFTPDWSSQGFVGLAAMTLAYS